jgi:type I restriction enzyme, S subunit
VGDVLVNSTGTGTLGRVAQVREAPSEPTSVDTHVTIVRPTAGRFYLDFFGYALIAIEDQLAASGEGTSGQTELSRSAIAEKFLIRFPRCLAEQQRIVAILEDAFEGIDRAIANTKQNLANARELLSTLRSSAFQKLGHSCSNVSLGNVCEFENGDRGVNYPGKEHRVPQGIPFINAGHLSEIGVDLSEMDYISPERFALLGNGKIRQNDVLFCLRGSLGKFASVGDLDEGAIASSLVILRPKASISVDYLLEYLASPICAASINKHKGGAAQPNLGAKDLKKFELPLPPLVTQKEFAARLSETAQSIRNLETISLQKLASLAELKRSLLDRAFSGELTAADGLREAAE